MRLFARAARLAAVGLTATLAASVLVSPPADAQTAAPALVSAVTSGGQPPIRAAAGAPGAGDPYFPLSGNGGFDVSHYGLSLTYDPTSGLLTGQAVISALATTSLRRFDLDFSGMAVQSVKVDGRSASFSRSGQELVITPSRPLGRFHRFSVTVAYSGVPQEATDPDGSPDGWIRTDDGAFVASEPQGAMTWFPSSSHPLDKATFDVTMTVPKAYEVVGNGELVSRRTSGSTTTFHWQENQPMAAYLATATVGKFQITSYRANGLPVYVAVDPREAAKANPVLAGIPDIIAWEENAFGPYPFTSTGAIVDHAPEVGYALETQTRPVFDRAPDTSTLVHELAHQWFGDSVSLTKWQDIWLNEGFATYAEWLYSEQHGGETAQQNFDERYAEPADADIWARPVADPGSGEFIFADPSYDRGAMVLQKLREAVGLPTFLKILQSWAAQYRYGHGTTAQFVALSERVSHQDLTALYQTWLYTAGKPATP